jgi:hypothetical protein
MRHHHESDDNEADEGEDERPSDEEVPHDVHSMKA